MPSGSRPLAGSSRTSSRGSPSSDWASAEPLPHPGRVAAGALARERRDAGQLEQLVDPGSGTPAAAAMVRRWSRPDAARVHVGRLERRADDGQRPVELGVRPAVDGRACPTSAGPGPAASAASWSCRRRWGPRKPVTRPGATVKLSSSTAVSDPNRLVSPANSTTTPGDGMTAILPRRRYTCAPHRLLSADRPAPAPELGDHGAVAGARSRRRCRSGRAGPAPRRWPPARRRRGPARGRLTSNPAATVAVPRELQARAKALSARAATRPPCATA